MTDCEGIIPDTMRHSEGPSRSPGKKIQITFVWTTFLGGLENRF